MNGHRHAASVLYGVSERDQDAVLAALPPADGRIVRSHLQELRALGFDAATVRAAVPVATGPAARLRGADAGAMAALLAPEPAGLVADVLALEAWPWSAALKESLPAARKVDLRMLAARPAPAPALAAQLLARLAARLADIEVPAPVAPVRPGWFERWTAWTR